MAIAKLRTKKGPHEFAALSIPIHCLRVPPSLEQSGHSFIDEADGVVGRLAGCVGEDSSLVGQNDRLRGQDGFAPRGKDLHKIRAGQYFDRLLRPGACGYRVGLRVGDVQLGQRRFERTGLRRLPKDKARIASGHR